MAASKTQIPRAYYIVIIAVGGIFLGVSLAQYFLRVPSASLPGLLWPNPKQIVSVTVTDTTGTAQSFPRDNGKWAMVFFGYTNCPDVCPSTLQTMQVMQEQLTSDEASRLELFFATVDPVRDTPAALAQYLSYFDGKIQGLTGSESEIEALTKAFGAVYIRATSNGMALPQNKTANTGSNNENYLVDHSAGVFLLDPQRRLLSILQHGTDATSMLAQYRSIRAFIASRG